MAKRKSRTWSPPAQGTRARRKMSRSAFLDPANRRYPFKEEIGGRMRVSERGLMAKNVVT